MSMIPCGPIAWSDGMLIEVQHFQQLERHIEHGLALRLEQTVQYFWGFSLLDVDEDSLGMGRLTIRRAKGVFQDGTPFSLPTHDPLPLPLSTAGAKAGDLACLAIQSARSGGAEMSFGENTMASRYRAVETEIRDSNAGLDSPGTPRTLIAHTGQLSTRLCWQSELRTDETALPVARVLSRRASQAVVLDTYFIPPLLDVRVHKVLGALNQEFQSVLRIRLAGSAGLRVLSAGGGIADLIEIMLRQTFAEYRMRLAHLDAFDLLPPSVLYLELVGLLGRLSVLPGIEEQLADVQFNYRHDDLQNSFESLVVTLRHSLARVIETPVVSLKFDERSEQMHVCMLDPQWKLQKIILAFSASMPAEKLRVRLPHQIKLGPIEQIQKLVDLQLPGARMIAMPHPPRQVPYYAQSIYFEVESTDPYWTQTLSGSAMALCIVGDFPDLTFEAWGLREGRIA